MNFPNPNWPTLFAEASFAVNPYYSTGTVVYTDLTPRLYKQWSIRRGKQFELDQIQPGEFNGQWINKDGFLDPSNTSSPFSPNVLPYRGYRMRAQYPPSYNLLDGDAATGGEVTPLAVGATSASVGSFYATPVVAASGTAWQGTQVWQVSVGAAAAVPHRLFFVVAPGVQALSGLVYTWTIQVRSLTTGANPVVQPIIQWVNTAGTTVQTDTASSVTLTGSVTATWTTITFTSTVPTTGTKVAAVVALNLTTAPASAWTFQADGIQWEQKSSASAFSTPGTNYSLMSGTVERYPQSWDYTGTYGLVNPIGVDTMAMLSQTLMIEAFVSETIQTSPGPQWFYLLNESSGATQFAEQNGRTGVANIATVGTGSCSPGSSISSTTAAGTFLGTGGPVVTFNNSTANNGVFIDLTPGLSSTVGVGPPSGTGWTRMLAFRTNSSTNETMAAINAGNSSPSAFDSSSYAKIQFVYQGASGGTILVRFTDSTGTVVGTITNSLVVNDNNWHLMFFTLASNGTTATLTVDSTVASTTFGSSVNFTGMYTDAVGGGYWSLNQGSDASNFVGDLALYAQWNYVLGSSTITDLYQVWRLAGQGETAGNRYARLLRYANYTGSTNIDVTATVNMAPADDINGLDVLTCLQNVVNTEYGRHFVDVNGAIAFQSRIRSFTATTPVWTFGENQASGEIPYVDLEFDFDPTHVSNMIEVTQSISDIVYNASDATSIQNYGGRTLTRTNQSVDSSEVQQQAYFLVSRYKNPSMRVNLMRIDVAANPALWTSILRFELGQYVAINRRSVSGATTISSFGFIEQITHTGDDQSGWIVELQISPVLNAIPYAVFTALKTTLNTNVSSGTNVITINALPDAATNPVRSELTGGQQLMIGSGATRETVTIATGGVQDQLAGYTTAQLTLTANLTHSHVTGEQVIEYNGVSYDTLGVFDMSLFPY